MDTIRIDKSASIAASEAYLDEIGRRPANLSLAEDLRNAACGGAAAIAQAAITWARRNPSGCLTSILVGNNSLDDFVKRLPGLVAVMMAGRIGDEGADRRAAYAAAKKVVSKMDEREYQDTTKGVGMSLICADQTTKGYLSPFYARSGISRPLLRSEEEFQHLAHQILNVAVGRVRFDDVGHIAEDLGVMIRELIDNTDRYARRDMDGNRLRKSVRCLHAQNYQISAGIIGSLASEYEPLANYLTKITERKRFNTTRVLEISIFDSGPGLAAHALGRSVPHDYDIADELRLVRSRFLDGNHEYARDGAGKGLRRTLERLKKDSGFIRLRTGRTSLYKDFSVGAGTILTSEDLQLEDAFGGLPGAHAEGTLLTLLVPLAVQPA